VLAQGNSHLANLGALPDDESELLQDQSKECPDRLLLVSNANTRPHFSSAKAGGLDGFHPYLARHHPSFASEERPCTLANRGSNKESYGLRTFFSRL